MRMGFAGFLATCEPHLQKVLWPVRRMNLRQIRRYLDSRSGPTNLTGSAFMATTHNLHYRTRISHLHYGQDVAHLPSQHTSSGVQQ